MTVGYEVDFMIDNHLNQPVFREEFGAADRWLAGMNAAAIGQNMSVQYCMALPSDLLVSLQNNAVTNYRASDDYAGSSVTNFNLQTSSLLGWALGLRPSKDVFYTTDNLPENPYWRRRKPTHPTVPGVDLELHAAIATLSTGPTAIGDGPGRTNETLIRRSCRADGWLLQPAKPPTAVDAQYDGRVAPAGGWAAAGGAQVWTTYTNISHAGQPLASEEAGAGLITWLVMSIDVETPFTLDPSRDLYPALGVGQATVWRSWHDSAHCVNGSHAVASGCVTLGVPKVHDTRPKDVATDSHVWSLTVGSAVMPSGWVLLGEPDKWVATSAVRFKRVTDTVESLTVELEGSAGEPMNILALKPLGASGDAGSAKEWEVREVRLECSGGLQAVVFR